MAKLKIYLDTSVINFLFAEDAPEFQKITKEFFDNFVKLGVYDFYISETVLAEINATKQQDLKMKLLTTVEDYGLKMVEDSLSEKVSTLSKLYITSGVFTEN